MGFEREERGVVLVGVKFFGEGIIGRSGRSWRREEGGFLI